MMAVKTENADDARQVVHVISCVSEVCSISEGGVSHVQ
jgi:hypothetical protein